MPGSRGRLRAGATAALAAALAGLALLPGPAAWGAAEAAGSRPHYLLVNETSQHDYDLALRMSLKLAEDKSGIENALVLVDALPEHQSIEQAAAALFTRWRVGARTHGRGVLYLYSLKENALKIEVSYELEPTITDLYCARMQEAAKAYMLSEMPQDFLSELIITTNLQGMATKAQAGDPRPPDWFTGGFLSGGGGALVHGYTRSLEDLERAIGKLPPHADRLLQPSTDPDETVRRYLASLDAGLGDPRLPLLTEGSRVFRAVIPRNGAQQRRVFEFFQAAGPYRLLVQGEFAIAAPRAGHSNLPVVLRRGSDGLWYVDEVKSWMWFHRFEDSTDFFVKYADNPFLRPLREGHWPHMDRPVYEAEVTTPRPPRYPYDLRAALRALEERVRKQPGDALAHAELGDFYLFETGWQRKALEQFEIAARLDPATPLYHWRLADLYLNASKAQAFVDELRTLARLKPADRELQREAEDYAAAYARLGP